MTKQTPKEKKQTPDNTGAAVTGVLLTCIGMPIVGLAAYLIMRKK